MKKINYLFYVSIFFCITLIIKFYNFIIPSLDFPILFVRRQPWYIYDDFRYSSIIIWLLAIIIIIWLIIKSIKSKKKLRNKLAIMALIISILAHMTFYITNPKYIYESTPKLFLYAWVTGEYITNKKLYFI